MTAIGTSPERKRRSASDAVVEQHLEERRNGRLGRGGDDRADEGEDEAAPAAGEERRDPAQPLAQPAAARVGLRQRSGGSARPPGRTVATVGSGTAVACGAGTIVGRFSVACTGSIDVCRQRHAGNSGRRGGLCMNMSFTYL